MGSGERAIYRLEVSARDMQLSECQCVYWNSLVSIVGAEKGADNPQLDN
jgi:hypothetical protein